MSTNKLIDVDLLTYYDSKTRIREDEKINSIPFANSMDYVKWYFDVHRDGKIYGVKFAYDANDCLVATGTKYGANANLVAQPSTRTVSGRNDYDDITVFKHFDANAHLDDNGNTIIDAIYGDKNFSYTGKVDVVCVFAPVYEKIYVGYESTTKYLYIEWCDTPRPGFILNKLCKDGQGNNKGFYCITKFQAGLIDGVPYASAGLYPWVKQGTIPGPSYNNSVDTYHARHDYMCAMTMAEWAMIQRIFLMKYGSTNYQSVFSTNANNYYLNYEIQFATNNKNYIVIPTDDANHFYSNIKINVGSGAITTENSFDIVCNTELLDKNDNIVIFNDLSSTGFTIVDANYSLVSIDDDIMCVKLATTGDARNVEDENIVAIFNNGSDMEVNLTLVVNGDTYTLYAYDGDNNEIGHSTEGIITNSILYISDSISTEVGNYVGAAVYKSGYSLDICGSDGCWEIGNVTVIDKYASVISGIEVTTGAWDIIGNAQINVVSGIFYVLLCNDPSRITKNTSDIDASYANIGYWDTGGLTRYNWVSNVRYDLYNGGLLLDFGNSYNNRGLCDAVNLSTINAHRQLPIFGYTYSGSVSGLWAATTAGYPTGSDFQMASRPSLNGVMG